MNKQFYTILLIVVCACAGISYGVSKYSSPKIAYIDFSEVYNNFALKIELEKEYNTIHIKRQEFLDSLRVVIQSISQSRDTSGLFTLQKKFTYHYDMFEHNNSLLKDGYYEKIVKQMNQYVKDFGKDYKYEIILGATGNGNIMYGSETKNISQDVIFYINKKYEGKK